MWPRPEAWVCFLPGAQALHPACPWARSFLSHTPPAVHHTFLTTSSVGQLPGVGRGLPQSLLGRAPDGQVSSSSLPCLLRRTGTVPVLLCMLSRHIGLCTENAEDKQGAPGLRQACPLGVGEPSSTSHVPEVMGEFSLAPLPRLYI